MSVLGKIWKITNNENNVPTLEKLLKNRNIVTSEQKIEFLRAEFDKLNHSPFLFRDMKKTITRIYEAIEKGERIIIFGDYDVDGISSTAILVHVLNRLGANVSYRLPHRVNDGYGLSKDFIEEFIEADVKLLITVDCGITCRSEISLAKKNGIDVVITDHHTIPAEMPDDSYSILHPLQKTSGYPFPYLTGAGVALKLGQALLQESDLENTQDDTDLIIAFATLGTVADLGALKGENRSLVKKGLTLLQKSEWKGLKYLKQYAGIGEDDEMTSHGIGYRLAPRINAAGRIDSPYLAIKLLLSNDDSAAALAEKLDKLNSERQVMTAKALEKAERLLDSQLQDEVLLAIVSDQWHAGILGLLAGRISEKYYRPAIVIEEREDELIGSARSIESFNIIQAISEESSLLSHFGGHHQAAGFTLKKENKDEFIHNIQNYARNTINWSELKPTLHIDCKVNFSEIDRDFYEEIKELEPYGTENEEPVFLVEGLSVKYPKKVGSNQNHLKFSACLNGRYLNAIGFNLGKNFNDLLNKDKIDVVCSIGINKWNGNESLQLKVLDFN